jgi:methylenetetrahydrofolate dehydrogenase (NADP+)/methenyltetrahydrofolate cyclohydrolase
LGTIVDGNALGREIRAEVAEGFAALAATASGPPPRVAIVQVGDDPAAGSYTRHLVRTFAQAGVEAEDHSLPASSSLADVTRLVSSLSASPAIHGIQVQTPLPPHIPLADVLTVLDPAKDLDGIHPMNAGLLAQGHPSIVPATPLGGLEILRRHAVPIAGARAAVIGRSMPVGRPMALLLLQHDATVTICHSRTRSLEVVLAEAEIVAVAVGRPGLVRAQMLRPGAAVIDFGTNFVDGKSVGDVEPAAAERAGLFTPVPGGTGPVTAAMLLRNALTLYRRAVESTT